jgi:uncharacterized membrane protein (UPF0127 family)
VIQLFIAFFYASTLLAQGPSLSKTELRFANGKTIKVEVAQSLSERTQGLMHRTELGRDEGMLFVFGQPQKLSFWMKNTFIPLSIAYIDSDRVIQEIYKMRPQNLLERFQHSESYPSQCDCQFALEMNQGWFKENKIKPGSKVQFQVPKKN